MIILPRGIENLRLISNAGSKKPDAPKDTINDHKIGETSASPAILPSGKLKPIKMPVISNKATGVFKHMSCFLVLCKVI